MQTAKTAPFAALLVVSKLLRTGFLFQASDYLSSNASFVGFHFIGFFVMAVVFAAISRPWESDKKVTTKQVGCLMTILALCLLLFSLSELL